MATKMRNETWDTLPRQSKLAAVMYPELVPDHIQREMRTISYGEGKTDPLTAKARTEGTRREAARTKPYVGWR